MGYVLILGARSDIAQATAKEYAKNGYDIYLSARNSEELEKFAKDIEIRYQKNVQLCDFDVLDFESHEMFYANLYEKPIGVVCAIGYLGEQVSSQIDFGEALLTINTNFTGIVSILNIVANDFEERKEGFIVGISSVAGDRGRKSNYTYGAAKAALSAYLSGLRNRLSKVGVHVMTVKPGFVSTKMTENMNLPQKLTSSPAEVARSIFLSQQKNRDVIYSSIIWVLIMLIIRNIPEKIFKKMSI